MQATTSPRVHTWADDDYSHHTDPWSDVYIDRGDPRQRRDCIDPRYISNVPLLWSHQLTWLRDMAKRTNNGHDQLRRTPVGIFYPSLLHDSADIAVDIYSKNTFLSQIHDLDCMCYNYWNINSHFTLVSSVLSIWAPHECRSTLPHHSTLYRSLPIIT